MDEAREKRDLSDESLADAVEGHALVGLGEPLLERVEGYSLMGVTAPDDPDPAGER